MTPSTVQRIVIFGGTSAIALAAARVWAQRGARLVLVGRNPAKLEAATADLNVRAGAVPNAAVAQYLVADLDLVEQHAGLIQAAIERLGGIDVALIAHGSLPDQAACERDPTQALREIQTNAISAVSLAERLGTLLQAQGGGTLAAISSVAGDRGRQSNYIYGASKGMLTLYLQGLRNRLSRHGVQVLTIKPGFVDTPMTAGIEKKGPLWATPEQVAMGIVKAIERRRDVVYLPGFWRLIMLIIRSIPESVFKGMKL